MAKKIKTPITQNKFATGLYVSLCIDAILKMRTGGELDEKIVELLIPLLEELFEDTEFLS